MTYDPGEGSAAKFTRMRREVVDLRAAADRETIRADKAEAACRNLARDLAEACAALKYHGIITAYQVRRGGAPLQIAAIGGEA